MELDSSAMPADGGLRRFTLAAVGAFGVWLLLVGSLDRQELIAGAVVALITAWLSGPHLHLLDGLRLRLSLPWHAARFAATFIGALVVANLDLARRVAAPSLPIDPATVRIRTGLRSGLGRLLLANAITLTPGTLTIDVDGDELLVHWIDIAPGTDIEPATAAIAGRFEALLAEMFE